TSYFLNIVPHLPTCLCFFQTLQQNRDYLEVFAPKLILKYFKNYFIKTCTFWSDSVLLIIN
ncbi:hypothetical protein, partial [Bacillus pseudomycoides]|uniref:hypothetical protein n=1 Tax=Bacillus pseudomycoides TaxID=64104 RepID=UPI001C54F15F